MDGAIEAVDMGKALEGLENLNHDNSRPP